MGINVMPQAASLTEKQKVLRFQQLSAGGHRMAWTFAVEHEWNLDHLREELAEREYIRDMPLEKGSPMTPGHSPRIFIDAYIATLKEAIEIIEVQQVDAAPSVTQ